MNATRTHGGSRYLGALPLLIALLAASGCGQSQGQLLIVQVTPILAAADTLQVVTVLGDAAPKVAQEVPDFAIASSAGRQYFTFGLRLPVGAAGKVVVGVAAVNKQTDCLLATGVAQTVASVIVDDSRSTQLDVTLTALPTPDCGQGLRRPRVLGISGAVPPSSISAGETLKVTGWGFLPGVQVSLAGRPAAVATWTSPLELTVQVPSLVGTLGPVELAVINSDAAQSKDQRLDLVSYIQRPAFAKETNYTCPEGSAGSAANSALFVAQLDGKAGPDVIFGLDYFGSNDGIYKLCVYLANGDGSLKPLVSYDTSASYGKTLIGDFDGTNGVDVAFAGIDDTTNSVYTMFNKGDGSFQSLNNGITYDLGVASYTILDTVAADLNNDKFTDIILLIEDYSGADSKYYIYTLLNNKAGNFTVQRAITLAAHNEYALAVADLNGDKFPDVALTYADGAPLPTVEVFLNQNGTAFSSGQSNAAYDPSGISPVTIAALDLNSDGKLDLALADGYLANQGAGSFQKALAYTFGQPLDLVNLNGDAALDTIFTTGYSLNRATSGIDWLPPVLPGSIELGFSATRFADLNGDGLADIIDGSDLLTFHVMLNVTK